MRLSPFALIDRMLAPAPPAERVAFLVGAAFAHRGLHGRPGGQARHGEAMEPVENAPAAFIAAIELGLGIECDVQISADGAAMVFHDSTLDRLTGESGPVASRAAAQLCAIALGRTGDTIPALKQVLELVAGRAPMLIEVKSHRGRPVAPLCRAVAEALQGYKGIFAVMSFDPRVPHWFCRHRPDIPRGLVMGRRDMRGFRSLPRRHFALWWARPDFLACDIEGLPNCFAASQRSRGLKLASWTVRTAENLARARIHADAVIAEGDAIHPIIGKHIARSSA